MENNRAFYFGLFFSLLIHSIFVTYSFLNQKNLIVPKVKHMEIVYQVIKGKGLEPKSSVKELEVLKKKRIPQKHKIEILSKKHGFPVSIGENIRDISKLGRNIRLDQKQTPKIIPRDMKRSIHIPFLKSEKISNPKYLGYTHSIQQKIKYRVNAHVSHMKLQPGDVYLTFIISSAGRLKQIKVIEEKTNADESFQSVCLRSVKESSPFQPFPDDLAYPELSFNILITSRGGN